MKKNLLFLLVIVALASCNSQEQKSDASATEEAVAELSINTLLADAENYVGKPVKISGTVDHVCREGGKKMFIFGDSAEDRIKITPGKRMNTFEVEMEGNDVVVEGILQEVRIDEEYIANMENDLQKSLAAKNVTDDGKHMGEKEGEQSENGMEALKSQIDQLKSQLDACGQDHLSFYSVECNKLVEVK